MTQSTVERPRRDVVDAVKQAPIRVLHIDDEHGFLKAAKQILEMQGAFQVDTASSVEEATEKMREKAYDAIVCDYIMPRRDGLQFLKELRDSGNNIPFIIFTGKGREEVAIKALNLGADRYLSKIGGPQTVYGELAHGIRQAVERKRADMEIWRREERLRAIFASSPDAITVIDLNGNITECNQATLDMLGYSSKNELVGKNGLAMVAKKDRERVKENLKRLLEKCSTKNNEYTALTKDGREFQAELSASIIKDSSGYPTGFVGIIRDTTERKKAEERIKESEERYRNLFENSEDVAIIFDLKGNITSINNAAVKYGFKKDEAIGKNMLKFVSKKYWSRLLKDVAQLARGKTVTGKIEINTPGGKRIAEYSSNSITVEGSVVGIQSVLRDITERKNMEDALRRSEEKHKRIVELAPDSIVTLDMKGVITSCNTATTRMTGYSKDEIVGKHFTKLGFLRARDIPRYLKLLSFAVRGNVPKSIEVNCIRKDGTPYSARCVLVC